MHKLKIIGGAASIVLLAAVIWLSNPEALFHTAAGANKIYIAAGLCVSVASVCFRVLKWKILVGVDYITLFPVQLFGMTVSNFTPGKAGEPAKALALKSVTGIPVSKSLPTIIWERVMDILVLLLLSVAFMHGAALSGDLLRFSYAGIGIFAAAFLLLLLVLTSRRFGEKFFGALRRFPPLKSLSRGFLETFYGTSFSKTTLAKSLIITAVPWVLDGVVLYLVLLSLGQNAAIISLAGIISISTIIGVASSLPGGIGSMEVVASLLLASLGIPSVTAVAAVLIFRAATFWFGSLLGALSFLYISRKYDMSAERLAG
ncbi:MAG TPA: lysylphosphatidylglycerol synthase transmembrane domain-containing protein [archaeon]|nr:lysylphosphatidylglycerol synthase transmembrane domain-containing protein [archaeon]